jgi:hypothetical protein
MEINHHNKYDNPFNDKIGFKAQITERIKLDIAVLKGGYFIEGAQPYEN